MILPDFEGEQFSYWNTNDWAKEWETRNAMIRDSHRSQFLIPGVKETLSANARRILGADVLYGGWMEDRSTLWRGSSYMGPSKFRHLGTDFVAPAESRVCIDEYAILVQVYNDTPEIEGWGTRLMFKLLDHENIHLVFGHLAPISLLNWKLGTEFEPLDEIGVLGTPEQNGGWSSHLHVQAIRGSVDEFINDPAALDGYGELADLEALAHRYPDPLRWISIR